MANKEIYELAEATLPLDGSEVVHMGQAGNSRKAPASAIASQNRMGQCRLALDGSDIRLSPFDGNLLAIAGLNYPIPSAGVSLSPVGLTVGSNYYVYAYMNLGTMALEASATGHSVDTATGVHIKTGDASRTLVGYVRIVTGPAFVDTVTQRFVRSWFNRTNAVQRGIFTATRTTTSTSFTELNSEIRIETLFWDGEAWDLSATGSVYSTTSAGIAVISGIGVNSTTTALVGTAYNQQQVSGYGMSFGATSTAENVTEGYAFATLLGMVSSGTADWYVGGGSECSIAGRIMQ